ncbi:hypothetical protein CVT24_004720 [Panaeolus cyanescens]|uniref:Uncharacterized protein n=1 Tax=Panaeolus cyanescens TaxID=181874 RepID=A0A409YSS0_9AGAR|nr:hypothetical protein CVT24_004720 [Panaeolus cyanescens]
MDVSEDEDPVDPTSQSLSSTDTPSPPNVSGPVPKKRKQSRSNWRRANKRREKVAKVGHDAPEWVVREHVQLSEPLQLPIDHTKLDVSASGYVGVRSRESKHALRKSHSLDELLAIGFEVVKWDGREARPILDSKGRVCGVLAGRPRGSRFQASLDRTYEFLQEESAAERFRPAESRHRRGPFEAVAFGMSFGGGQSTAKRLAPGSHAQLVERFMANDDIACLANFADSAFRTWSPRLYQYYRTTLHKAAAHNKQRLNFPGSCFAAMSVNMGGRVCCFKHRDCVNLAFGWCAITSLGNFGPEKGGHFVLWDLKLAIEFPPGATLLIPSAVFSHSNTSIGDHEERFSVTQYTAGALFRWVENGFKTDEELRVKDPEHYTHMQAMKASRFEKGVEMYCTLDELSMDAADEQMGGDDVDTVGTSQTEEIELSPVNDTQDLYCDFMDGDILPVHSKESWDIMGINPESLLETPQSPVYKDSDAVQATALAPNEPAPPLCQDPKTTNLDAGAIPEPEAAEADRQVVLGCHDLSRVPRSLWPLHLTPKKRSPNLLKRKSSRERVEDGASMVSTSMVGGISGSANLNSNKLSVACNTDDLLPAPSHASVSTGTAHFESRRGMGAAGTVLADSESPSRMTRIVAHRRALDLSLEILDREIGLVHDRRDNVLGKKGMRQRLHRQNQKAKKFDLYGHLPSLSAIQNHIGSANPVLVEANLPSLPFARCGFQAVNEPVDQKDICTLEMLTNDGYQVIEYKQGTSQPIVDSTTGKVFGVVVGALEDPTYHQSAEKAFEFLDEISKDVQFDAKETKHRRGDFAAVTYGVSYGQGSQEPHWLRCPHDELMQKVFSNEHIKRLATFASYTFAMWAPNVYDYYRRQIKLLHVKMPQLKWMFYNTVWLCATINFGPHVCCLPHRDLLNLPFGWCSIIALGDFDYKKGGHLVLHDLRMVIEFPPGCVILIPSALLNHANTPLQPGERRMSFTQFCAGGIFRFIENGFRTEKQLKKDDKKTYEEMMKAKEGRKDMGIGMWSTLDELLAPRSK